MFGFSGSKSKSSSTSNANTYVDREQAPYLADIRSQARNLNNNGGMPVEGVAGLNQTQLNAMGMANQAGQMQAGAGANLMAQGSGLTQGSGAAMNYAGQTMGGNAGQGIGTALGTGNQYAGGTMNVNAAQGGGADYRMAGRMGGMAAQSGMAQNQGINTGNINSYMNNSVIDGQVDAVSRDITRNLRENELTGNASVAIGGGNMGSSMKQKLDFGAGQRAADRIADASASIRGNAYNQGLGIEAGRATQNAQLSQGTNQFNAGAQNSAQNQGYNIGASQLQGNLGRSQQAAMGNQGAYNSARQFGTGVGANAFNTNMQNQQFGANMAQQLGQQGVSNMQAGQNMTNTGIGMAAGAGDQQRAYDQQLLGNQYQQGMAPYNSLNFYNSVVGAPNNLSTATASSKGKSSSIGMSFG
ncbi:hypothetical protein N8303_07080 [Gammaproteobacteria bacterium]|nr:hypothetical protein [Gammaproteobacteria bacterium]